MSTLPPPPFNLGIFIYCFPQTIKWKNKIKTRFETFITYICRKLSVNDAMHVLQYGWEPFLMRRILIGFKANHTGNNIQHLPRTAMVRPRLARPKSSGLILKRFLKIQLEITIKTFNYWNYFSENDVTIR